MSLPDPVPRTPSVVRANDGIGPARAFPRYGGFLIGLRSYPFRPHRRESLPQQRAAFGSCPTYRRVRMTLDLPAVPGPDLGAAARAATRREQLPAGALGVWGAVLDAMAAAPADTLGRAGALRDGIGLPAALAAVAGVGIRVVDVGMSVPTTGAAKDEGATSAGEPGRDGPATPGPSGRIDREDALGEAQLLAAIDAGRAAADAEVDEGADLLIGAVCGVGVSTPVSVLVAALTGMEPVDATTRGSGIDDAAWIRKAAAVRDALFRVRRAGTDVLSMLRTGGGADLAALTGFIAQAAIRRTPVLIH